MKVLTPADGLAGSKIHVVGVGVLASEELRGLRGRNQGAANGSDGGGLGGGDDPVFRAGGTIIELVGNAVVGAGRRGSAVGRETGVELTLRTQLHGEVAGRNGLSGGGGEGRPQDDDGTLRGSAVGAVDGIDDLTQCGT